MYTSFFGLTEKPFAITPDPRYLYLSERHAEALAHLLYGIDDAGGFIQLTGEVGTGKTTIVRSLLAQLPAHADVALILNPRVTPEEFLLAICDELRQPLPASARGSIKTIVDELNRLLLEAHGRGRRVVVIVDEAQQLSAEVLEQVRLLTNLETATHKLLQIILVGQPELRELLARTDLRQLAQRITGRYHLAPLSAAEARAYVGHRLKVAGATRELFGAAALAELYHLARGVPRLINVIADRALLGAYTREQPRVTAALVRRAAGEVHGRRFVPRWLPWALSASGFAAVALLAFALLALRHAHVPAAAPTAALAQASAPRARPPMIADFLARHVAETGTDAAFARLFALWRTPFDAHAGRPCEQAAAQGLQCMSDRGTLAQLRLLNRPAILSLLAPDGTEHQLVIAALTDSDARLEAGGSSLEAELNDLQRWWYGDFLVLWRPPLPLARMLTPGDRGAEVHWLRQSLATLHGEPLPPGPDVYDHELVRRVEEFQRAHRLEVDGIAGERTQVMLDALLGSPGTPTLQSAGG